MPAQRAEDYERHGMCEILGTADPNPKETPKTQSKSDKSDQGASDQSDKPDTDEE